MDDVTWQVLTAVLTMGGLALSALAWKRRGVASGIRGVAWSLIPLAAFLTGTLRLLWEIGDAVATWAVRLVFSPFVWLGIVVAGVSATLFVVSSFMRRRGVGVRSGSRGRVRSGKDKQALPSPSRGSGEPAGSSAGDDDLADIEAILKKHGIS